MVFANGNVKFTGSGMQNYSRASETIPAGYRPISGNTPIHFLNVGFACLLGTAGDITMLGDPKSGYSSAQGAWVTNDAMPA
ncbi:hypothetical protein ALMA_1414 [Alloscardovia macacae]|uniref:Uncharacterized protein n=1 Tax=Alloscardovia macacae TaxID=1160091 RepID=A0A261F1W4_9BIFI|nr:hypothetical protein ALMA_1414 [Alloscardovia macacae]